MLIEVEKKEYQRQILEIEQCSKQTLEHLQHEHEIKLNAKDEILRNVEHNHDKAMEHMMGRIEAE